MSQAVSHATTLTSALEALPPFGPALAELGALDAALVQALGRAPDAPLAVRALIRRGERQLVLGQEEAAATFAEAARRAMALGDAERDAHARLWCVRALAELGSAADARALMERADRDAEHFPAIQLTRGLARAALRAEGATSSLQHALTEPGPVSRRREEHDGWLALGEALERDARWREADSAYARAQALAHSAQDAALAARVALIRALSLLRHGLPRQAAPLLNAVWIEGEPALRLTAGLLLSGLALAEGDARAAGPLAASCQALALERRSWLAYASASIDLAMARGLEDPEAEAATLLESLARCRALGEPGALLQSRLLELRGQRRQRPEEPEAAPVVDEGVGGAVEEDDEGVG